MPATIGYGATDYGTDTNPEQHRADIVRDLPCNPTEERSVGALAQFPFWAYRHK